MPPPHSFLDLINVCDNFPYRHSPEFEAKTSHLVHFRIAALPEVTLGYVLPHVAEAFSTLEEVSGWEYSPTSKPPVILLSIGNDEASRSNVIATTFSLLKDKDKFNLKHTWRAELYGVYGPQGEMLFKVERSAAQLIGVVTYGVHMTAFRRTPSHEYEIWVPRRAATKQTFPNMLDNSVAGGIPAGEAPMECLVRECAEEASLSEEIARKSKSVGSVTYFYISGTGSGGEMGLLQPECEFVYDLDLTGIDITLKPSDDEVAGFECLGVEDVRKALANGEFKPNCAVIMIDFMMRHGMVTEKDDGYVEIGARLHRRLEFPLVRRYGGH
jgi:isopentenyldiphosphate isomerase